MGELVCSCRKLGRVCRGKGLFKQREELVIVPLGLRGPGMGFCGHERGSREDGEMHERAACRASWLMAADRRGRH